MNFNLINELKILIAAKYPIIYIVSWEENRVESVLKSIANELGKKIYFWSLTTGITDTLDKPNFFVNDTCDPLKALRKFLETDEKAIFVFKDLHHFLKDSIIIRLLREIVKEVVNSRKNFIILSPICEIPIELSKEITIFDFPLPDFDDLKNILDGIIKTSQKSVNFEILLNETEKEQIIKAALGLTYTEAENVFARALVENKKLNKEDIELILKEKQQIIRKSGILEYYEVKEDMENVGGLNVLKEWAKKRTRAFTDEARKFGLPEPKGVLLLGVQGCGKSLCAKAIASMWKLPLLRLDVGAIFNKYIGESEANVRKTINIAESIAPVILWIDELEKAFGGIKGDGDAGTSSRVFATFLTWLQEKTKPVFVIATSNDITLLPPEFVRKGRFDEIFFVDLPNFNERKEIFKIHLKKRNKNVDKYNLDEMASHTQGFSGAEIEQVVISALYDAFDSNRELTQIDILNNIKKTVPLSLTAAEKINWLREWAKTRAVFASREN